MHCDIQGIAYQSTLISLFYVMPNDTCKNKSLTKITFFFLRGEITYINLKIPLTVCEENHAYVHTYDVRLRGVNNTL